VAGPLFPRESGYPRSGWVRGWASPAVRPTRQHTALWIVLLLLVPLAAHARELFHSGFEEESRLLLRDSFETRHETLSGPAGWVAWDAWNDPAALYAWDAAFAASGTHSLLLSDASTRFAYRSDPVPVDPSGALVLKGMVRLDGVHDPRGATLGILLLDGAGKQVSLAESRPLLGTEDWQPLDVPCLVDAEATNAAAVCILSGGGQAWFDDIELRWMPELTLDAPAHWHSIPLPAEETGQFAWVDDDVRSGERAIRLWGATRRFGYAGDASPIEPTDSLKASGWVRTEWVQGANGATVGVQFFDAGKRLVDIMESEPVIGTTPWRRVTLGCPAPEGAAWAAPICLVNGPGVAWFDDIRLSATEAEPVKLLDVSMSPTVEPGESFTIRLTVQAQRAIEKDEPLTLELVPLAQGGTPLRYAYNLEPPPTAWPVEHLVSLVPCIVPIGQYVAQGVYRLDLQLGPLGMQADVPLPRLSISQRHVELPLGAAVRMALSAPAEFQGGNVLEARIECQFAGPNRAGAMGYLSLLDAEGRLLYDEVPVDFTRPSAGERVPLSARVLIGIPPDMPPGDYRLRCGLIGPFAVGGAREQRVRITQAGVPSKTPPLPMAHGTFVDKAGASHRWYVDRRGTLVWDGQPYAPVGGVVATGFIATYIPDDDELNDKKFAPFEQRLDLLREQGVRDVYLTPACDLLSRPPHVIQRVLDAMEARGLRYGLRIGGAVDEGSTAYAVGKPFIYPHAPGGERCNLALPIPTADPGHAIVIAFDEATGEVARTQLAPILHPAGIEVPTSAVEFTVGEPGDGRTYCVHVVPQCEVEAERGVGDLWSSFDRRRARLTDYLSRLSYGPGFRFFLSPLCSDMQLRPLDCIPDETTGMSAAFASWLEVCYQDVGALAAEWGLDRTPAGFGVAGRLIPSARRGDRLYMVDPVGLEVFTIPREAGRFVADLDRFREESVAEDLAMLIDDLKAIADVPVVVEREWESRAFFTALAAHGGPDGVAVRAFGEADQLAELTVLTGVAEASLGRHTLWPIVSQAGRSMELAGSDIGFGSPDNLRAALEAMVAAGARGVFVLGASLDNVARLANHDMGRAPEQLAELTRFAGDMQARVPVLKPPPFVYVYPALRHPTSSRPVCGLEGSLPGRMPFTGPTGQWVVPAPAAGGAGGDFIVVVDRATNAPMSAEDVRSITESLGRRVVVVGTPRDTSSDLGLLANYYTARCETLPGGGRVQVLRVPDGARALGVLPDGSAWHTVDGNLEIIAAEPMSLDDVLQRSVLLGRGDLSCEPKPLAGAVTADAEGTVPVF